ncbi:MAG TPA: PAS domain S-box protein [Pseudolabrys sp.]|nr:PAS domain S-box protein [Pseudolabrys sp.]
MTKTSQTNEKMLAMNEALVLGSVRQHELTEAAETLNARLQEEIAERKQAETALRESEDRYRNLFNSMDEGYCIIEMIFDKREKPVDYRFLEVNRAFDKQSGMHDVTGKRMLEFVTEIEEHWLVNYGKVAVTGEPVRFENEYKSLGRWFDVYAFKIGEPGSRRVAVLFTDITEHKRSEEALRESEERFRAMFELGPVAVYFCDASGVIQNFNRRAVELWNREPASGDTDERFCGSFKLFRPDGSFMPHEQCPMAEVISGKISVARDVEVLIERTDGSRVTVVVNIRPLKNQRGEVTGAINCFYDITDRKEAEERQQLLMNELAHRGKNLLAVVHSIASRTMSGTRSLAEAREVLANRIQALARSQTVLMADGFEYASLTEIIRLEIEGFSDRVNADGPDVMLNSKTAQTFALLIHELATNATKYGALSQAVGHVSIQWKVEGTGEEAEFRFRWQEHDGPPVKPPTREGFGRILLEKVVAQDFGAKPKVSFAPEGLDYEIHAPLSVMAASSAPPPPGGGGP